MPLTTADLRGQGSPEKRRVNRVTAVCEIDPDIQSADDLKVTVKGVLEYLPMVVTVRIVNVETNVEATDG